MPNSVLYRLAPALFAVSLGISGHAAEKLTAAPAVKKAAPAVVHISVNQAIRGQVFDFFPFPMPDRSPREPVPGSGSGVIIDAAEGYVVTNHHVIDNAEEITVRLEDRRTLQAELIGSDPLTDIALLRIEAEDVSELPLGDSDTLEIGDFVVAIGSPFNLDQTVTLGIVSALGRTSINRGERYEDFRRAARRPRGPPGRHQHGAALAWQRGRRQCGHRFCRALEHGARRGGPIAGVRRDQARAPRRADRGSVTGHSAGL